MYMEVINEGTPGRTRPKPQTNRDWAMLSGVTLTDALKMAREDYGSEDALPSWLDAPHCPSAAETADTLRGLMLDVDANGGTVDLTHADRTALMTAIIFARGAIDSLDSISSRLAGGWEILLCDGCRDLAAISAFMDAFVKWEEKAKKEERK